MFCIKCGSKIADGSKFCMVCGAAQRPDGDASGLKAQAEQAEGTTPSSSDAASAAQHLDLAFEYEGRGLLPGALRECDRTLELAPQMSEAHHLRGKVLERLDRPLEARAAYQQALDLSPGHSEARENLNRLAVKLASEHSVRGRSFTTLSSRSEQASGSGAAIAGAIVGIVGGAVIVLGWLTPWFGIGGLLGALGSMAGLSGRGLLGTGSGVGLGSGVQLMTALVAGGFAAFGLEVYGLGLLALMLAGVLISIPILGGLIVRQGIRFLEIRATRSKIAAFSIREGYQSYRKRSGAVFGIMLSIFVLLALLGGAAMLGLGFYMTIFGAIGTYVASIVPRFQVDES